MVRHLRPSCSHATSVLPLPPKGSSTVHPGLLLLRRRRAISFTGFMVGCSALTDGLSSWIAVVAVLSA